MTNKEVMTLLFDMGIHDSLNEEDWIPDNAWVLFANRVAAHERDKCAKTVEALFDEVSNLKLNNSATNKLVNNVATIFKVDIAAAIRARGHFGVEE